MLSIPAFKRAVVRLPLVAWMGFQMGVALRRLVLPMAEPLSNVEKALAVPDSLSAVLTTEANDLVADIHDRMPVILRPEDYDRWLGIEPDPRDLLRPFPAELVTMWPISTRVNSPKNDDADLLTPRSPGQQRQSRGRAEPGVIAPVCALPYHLRAKVRLCDSIPRLPRSPMAKRGLFPHVPSLVQLFSCWRQSDD